MGSSKRFLEGKRETQIKLPVLERVRGWGEFERTLPIASVEGQGGRCMDCGTPFCQADTGCPVQNVIPDWNELVYHGQWREASASLHATNNFPEFTGRLCPAPCESACVLGLIEEPVAIRHIEQAIADHGWDEGWVAPVRPAEETGRRIAVVGSGPAGLAGAQQLRRMGHRAVVFERDDRIGGLLRYGIPDFKMERWVLERRLDQLRAEGVEFRTGVDVGADISLDALRAEYDAVLLAGGAQAPRDAPVPGRELAGIHFAMEYLTQQNRVCAGDEIEPAARISAAGKRVVVVGGGDTGSDCIGTAIRQGAREVRQLVMYPRPPEERAEHTPWPLWPMKLYTTHAHEEGGAREWQVLVRAFSGSGGRVERLHAARVNVTKSPDGQRHIEELPGGELTLATDLVLLAIGYTGPEPSTIVDQLGRDRWGNVPTDVDYRTTLDGVFAAGDMRRGASLIVWAIREGRDAAAMIDRYVRQPG